MPKIITRDLHQSWFLVAIFIGIIVGTIFAIIFRINYFSSDIWLIVVALSLIPLYFKPKALLIPFAIMIGMILAFCRISSELQGEDYIKQFHNHYVEITGVIDGDPETEDKTTKVKIKQLTFGQNFPTKGNLYLSLPAYSSLKRQDTITVSGELKPGFGTYAGYMYKPVIKKILHPNPGDFILKLRDWFATRVAQLVPEPEINLGLSYLLGMKSNLPDDLAENLRTVGLVHIVVASGAHLSILVGIARKLFGKLSRFSGLLFSISFILFFMSMVGFTPSILRAGLMSILSLLAWYVGRKFQPWRIILIVMAITLLLNPMYLINLGWFLSFASYAGIMIISPKLIEVFYGDQKPKFIASTVLVTISATLMTLPIVLYFYGSISLISVIANLLILPTLPYAMGLTFLTGVTANLPYLSTIIAWCTKTILDFHIMVVEFFGSMKSFLIQIKAENPYVFLIYIIIIVPLLIGLIRSKMVKYNQYLH